MLRHALLVVVKRSSAFYRLIPLLLLASCGSHLPRVKKINQTVGLGLDLTKITFEDLESGETVTLSDYMNRNNKEFLLLIFGSVGCGVCNQKARDLSANFEGKHPLLLTRSEKKFDLIGINTDTGAARARFNGIMLDSNKRAEHGYDFIKWNDAMGEVMQEYFLDPNEAFGVPFVTLINRKRILWSYNNKMHYTLQEVLDRAEQTIEGSDPGSSNSSAGSIDEPVEDFTQAFQFESPNRFRELNVKSCSGAEGNLHQLSAKSDLTFIQISRDACADGSDCAANFAQFKSYGDICVVDGVTESCRFITLTLSTADSARCAEGSIYQGGKEFYETFSSHFDWNHQPLTDNFGTPIKVPEVGGPMVLGFKRSGKLIYSWEGVLPDKTDAASIQTTLDRGANTRAVGANFLLFQGRELVYFSEISQKSRFTVFTSFDRLCGSCLEELEHWSGAANMTGEETILDYCAKDPSFCQVIALEGSLANPNNTVGRTSFYQEIAEDFFKPNKIKVPFYLDVNSVNDYGRVFESYLSLIHPQWEGVYGTVIYDNEGKILMGFKSTGAKTPDPVLTTLQIYKNKGR